MASAYYDINAQQSSTFNFHVEYYDENGNPVDLSGYTARFQVRPNNDSTRLYLHISNNGEVISGGTAGDFGATGGLGGVGGITLNVGSTGSPMLGGMLISADHVSMSYMRPGSWKYSIDLSKNGRTDELMSGRFVVAPKITRLGEGVLPGSTLSFVGLTLGLSTNIFGHLVSLGGGSGGVTQLTAGTGIQVSGPTGAITITNAGVQSFNGNTGAIEGVSAWNGQTGSVSFVNYVNKFTGLTGAVGITGGTSILVSESGGTFTISYIGGAGNPIINYVESFNGNTGVVTGASLGANTFTGLNTFNSGILVSDINTTTLTSVGSVDIGGNLSINGARVECDAVFRGLTVDYNPLLVFSGATVSELTVSGASYLTGDVTAKARLTVSDVSNLSGTTATALNVSGATRLNGGATASSLNVTGASRLNGGVTASTLDTTGAARFSGGATASTLDVTGQSRFTGNISAPNIVNSFNGNIGAVQGVSAASAGTGIHVNGSTGSVTITNIGVQSFNGNTGAIQGVSYASAGLGIQLNGNTGAVEITNIGVRSFNGNTGAVSGASLGANTFTALNTFNTGLCAAGATFTAGVIVNGAVRGSVSNTHFRLQGNSGPITITYSDNAGTTGDICWDSEYIYVCVSTNNWKRTALTTFPTSSGPGPL